MAGRGHRGAAAQDHLVAHELAVVFADRSDCRPKAGIGNVRTRRPLPYVAEHLPQSRLINERPRQWVGARVKLAGVRKVAGYRKTRGGDLPLGFARQPLAGPFGEGVSFEKTDVADRLERVQSAASGQSEDGPLAAVAAPIERRLPALLANRGPAIRKPEFRPLVAAGLDETEILGAADRPYREAERFEPHFVARGLVVERKGRAVVSDLDEPARELDPGRRRGRSPELGPRRLVGREQGIDRKHVLDVHQDQFLMLLLVMKPELDKRGRLAPRFGGRLLDQPRHRGADVVTIGT